MISLFIPVILQVAGGRIVTWLIREPRFVGAAVCRLPAI